jgi:high-affinity nickel-transport protein
VWVDAAPVSFFVPRILLMAELMTSAFVVLSIGFFLGMRHATDPDHVVAVSTIVSRERSIPRAGWIGVLWGIGHTLTILVVGATIVLFGVVIPPRLGLTLEFSVALMLILLGVLNLTGALNWISHRFSPTHPRHRGTHSHLHSHGDYAHDHLHSHSSEMQHHPSEIEPPRWLRAPFAQLGLFHSLRPFLIGVVHGLAGSAAVALLVLSTIREPLWAIFYLLVFGVGTIVGMMLMTLFFSVPFTIAATRFAWLNRSLVTATGVVSLIFGLVVAYQIGIVDGLFTAHPAWTPH